MNKNKTFQKIFLIINESFIDNLDISMFDYLIDFDNSINNIPKSIKMNILKNKIKYCKISKVGKNQFEKSSEEWRNNLKKFLKLNDSFITIDKDLLKLMSKDKSKK
jgi:hypothetical protein